MILTHVQHDEMVFILCLAQKSNLARLNDFVKFFPAQHIRLAAQRRVVEAVNAGGFHFVDQ